MKAALSGSLRLCVEQVDSKSAVESVVAALEHAAKGKGVFVKIESDPELPSIQADLIRFKKIIWNVLSNGIKFTPSGGSVTLQILRATRGISIRIQDTGCGLSAEHLEHLFEPFHQVDGSSTREHGGLGLGLAITRHLVQLHGGTITAHSAGLGQGATVEIQMP